MKFAPSIIVVLTLGLTLLAILSAADMKSAASYVLVGQGCEGKSDVAVAIEEDMLPICERIDVHEVKESY